MPPPPNTPTPEQDDSLRQQTIGLRSRPRSEDQMITELRDRPDMPSETFAQTGPYRWAAAGAHNGSPEGGARATDDAEAINEPEIPTTSNPQIIPIDYKELIYMDNVDETLNCPICHTPFYEPVTTKDCGHTFCKSCLSRAVKEQPICPIDRLYIGTAKHICTTRIVTHQIDCLRVKCPNFGCGLTTTRASLETHYERQCPYTTVPCPDPECSARVMRVDYDPSMGCLHTQTEVCAYCSKVVAKVDLETHYATACEVRTAECGFCGNVLVSKQMRYHEAHLCPEATDPCRWTDFGCNFVTRRKMLEEHEQQCVYRAIAKLAVDRQSDKAIIDQLHRSRQADRAIIDQLHRNRIEDRAYIAGLKNSLDILESKVRSRRHANLSGGTAGLSLRSGLVSQDDMALQPSADPRGQTPGANGNGPWGPGSPEAYMLAQFERMEAKIENLYKILAELDARHGVMLANEAIPLKDQIAELHSKMGVINMHTTWLINMQRHQNRFAANASWHGHQQQQQQQQQQQEQGRLPGDANDGSASVGSSGTTSGHGRVVDPGTASHERVYPLMPRRLSDGRNPPRL